MNFRLNVNFSNPFRKLAAEPTAEKTKGKRLPHKPKAVFRTRKDVEDWNRAITAFNYADEPLNYLIQLLYNEIITDALLYSQIMNRMQQSFSSNFGLYKPDGNVDEEQTAFIKNLPATRILNTAIVESVFYGYNLVEIDLVKDASGKVKPEIDILPRTNVVPQNGTFYPDYTNTGEKIKYRELSEFGTWILEFNRKDIGLLNRTVSHVLFKRFAQSCWSELCEIFGIPPRVIKTNTRDETMLDRAEKMMKDTGSAPWFIIDDSETFEWGNSVVTKGEVFQNLIQLCNNEMCMAVTGAIIGQDTVNGNRSKDESAQEMLWMLVKSDMDLIEQEWNTQILPALKKLGVLKGDLSFKFDEAEDIAQLWKFTEGLLPYKEMDNEWLNEKFNVKVTGDKKQNDIPPVSEKKKALKLAGFFEQAPH
ncbi:MAG: DUF935 family protein [Bacteroidota bacterium]